jgi:hypothetical protein
MLPNLARKMPANEVAKYLVQKMLTRRSMMPSGHSLSWAIPLSLIFNLHRQTDRLKGLRA